MRTVSSQKSTLRLVMGGRAKSGSALTPFGPVRAGLTISPNHLTQKENLDQQLTVLLNSLEKNLAELTSKSCEACDTYITGTYRLVRLTGTHLEGVGTNG